jgi:hypothetical protein
MPLPLPAEYGDWQSFATALLQALGQGDAEVVSGSTGGPAGYIPPGFFPLWMQDGTGELYYGNASGTPPTAPDIVFIDTAAIADAAIETAKISPGAVNNNALADLAVGTAKLSDLAVVTAKINDAAIVSAKIGDLQVVTAKIADLAVNNGKIANLAVGSANIQDAAVTNLKVGALAVGTANIITSSITSALIQNGTIVTADIGSAQITTALIGSAQITNALIASAAVGSAQIINASILTADIALAQITAALIANLAVGTAAIQDAAIIAAKIGDAEVGTLKLAGQAVTIPVSAYTAGIVTVPGSSGYTTVQSCAITSTGAPISINASFYLGYLSSIPSFGHSSVSPSQCFWQIVRGATVIYGPVSIAEAESSGAYRGTGPNAAICQDVPGAGTFTYSIQITTLDANAAQVAFRSLQLLETKR